MSRVGLGYWTGNLSYLPPYIILFALGYIAAEGYWLERIPANKAKAWGMIGLVSASILLLGLGSQIRGQGFSSEFLKLYGTTLYLIISKFIAWGVIA